jgi:hypothetical protein
MNPHSLDHEVSTHLMLRERLREAFPEADDDDLQDTLEGLTNLPEMLAALMRSQLDDLSLAEALKGRIGDMRTRLARLEHRVATKREIAASVMERAEIKKITEPDFTASFGVGGPKVSVTSEAEIPSQYWKPQDPKLDRLALAAALKAGQAVPGALLTNGNPFISVRTK